MYLPFLLTVRLGVRVLEVMRAAPHLRLLGVLGGEIWGESVDMRSEPPSLVDSAPLSEEESEDVSAVPRHHGVSSSKFAGQPMDASVWLPGSVLASPH